MCASPATSQSNTARSSEASSGRILKWIFRKNGDSVVCELALAGDHSTYELRIDPPWSSSGTAAERFHKAIAAFERQMAIERVLIEDGWSLESFESCRGVRE